MSNLIPLKFCLLICASYLIISEGGRVTCTIFTQMPLNGISGFRTHQLRYHKMHPFSLGLFCFERIEIFDHLNSESYLFLPAAGECGSGEHKALSAINCSRSLLGRKDCCLTLTADVGRMVKKGNLIVFSLVLMVQGVILVCSAARSWHCRAAAFSPPDILSAWQK